MAGLFPLFFSAVAIGDLDPTSTTNYLALSNSIASLVVALLAPILGAIADHGTLKKKLLIFFAFLGILMTISMGFIMQGYWIVAFIVYIFATIGFSSAPGLIRILGFTPELMSITFIGAGSWMLIAMVIAVRQALDYQSTWRAIGVVVIGFLVQAIILIMILRIFGPA